jgi:hypothetical protein
VAIGGIGFVVWAPTLGWYLERLGVGSESRG